MFIKNKIMFVVGSITLKTKEERRSVQQQQ